MTLRCFPGVIFTSFRAERALRKPKYPLTLITRAYNRGSAEVSLMKKKVTRLAAKKAAPRKLKKAPTRRLVLKAAPADTMTADEVSHLETLVTRFEASEKAWQRMTAPIDDVDPWAHVEEHMLERRDGDSERRWKFFAK